MPERLISMEEVDDKLISAQKEVIFFMAMKEIMEEGDFIMYDDETDKYRSIRKGMPVAFSS